jgi:signal peptide peptidase SppA
MDTIIQIMNQPWAIEPSANESFRMALIAAIRSGQIDAFEKKITTDTITTKVYSHSVESMVVDSDYYSLENLDIPDDSVALIYVEGCIYPWKSFRLENEIAKVNGNPKLLGAVVLMNTPGGAVHRVDITSDAIANSEKPIAGYITGMCASAGMYLISGAKRIFVASPSDRIGSIGTMSTYTDYRKYYEELGIIEKDIYATLSTEKNAESRALQAGDEKPIIAVLDFANDLFHKNISTNRKIKLDTENPVFKGAVFHTQEAIANGLADQMGTLDEALIWVLNEGLRLQANKL